MMSPKITQLTSDITNTSHQLTLAKFAGVTLANMQHSTEHHVQLDFKRKHLDLTPYYC